MEVLGERMTAGTQKGGRARKKRTAASELVNRGNIRTDEYAERAVCVLLVLPSDFTNHQGLVRLPVSVISY